MTSPALVPPRTSPLWRAAQAVSVGAALGVVGLLVLRPELGLFVTWSALIPAVPALLLLAPRVWRNLCPIAVVHQAPALLSRAGRRRLSPRAEQRAPVIAALALFAIVPLRHPIFNQSGPALAIFVVAVLVVALAGGLLFAGKSGFCATYCPVAPVERLYGQEPVIEPRHAHCASCARCSSPCFDREGARAVAAIAGEAGPGAARAGLLSTPMGAFAAAFPGFVLGYFTVPEGASLGAIYLRVAALAAASSVTLALVQKVTRASARTSIRLGAAVAAGLYYWFTVPSVAGAFARTFGLGAPEWALHAARACLLALVALWLLDAPRRARQSGTITQ